MRAEQTFTGPWMPDVLDGAGRIVKAHGGPDEDQVICRVVEHIGDDHGREGLYVLALVLTIAGIPDEIAAADPVAMKVKINPDFGPEAYEGHHQKCADFVLAVLRHDQQKAWEVWDGEACEDGDEVECERASEFLTLLLNMAIHAICNKIHGRWREAHARLN